MSINVVTSTHNHSTGSDGQLAPEEVVKKAISLGWKEIYFTDHYFPPPQYKLKPKYHFRFSENYIQEIRGLKEKYSGKINVYLGVEFDWYEDSKDWIREQSEKNDLDYVIGSIHRLFFDGKRFEMEPGKEVWIKNVEEFGGVKKVVKEYYRQIRNIAKSGIFDAIGHLDYVKIYNGDGEFFSEDDEWYRQEIFKMLDVIKKYDMTIEVNHGGIRKRGSSFPGRWVLEEANKRNIPLTLGLDAHCEEHYDNNYLDELVGIAKDAGYGEVVRFERRERIEEGL